MHKFQNLVLHICIQNFRFVSELKKFRTKIHNLSNHALHINMALILDNGGYTIKHGMVDSEAPQLNYNCLARIKHVLELAPQSLTGHREIYRPIERGLLVDLTL
jgi:hypothetical protein